MTREISRQAFLRAALGTVTAGGLVSGCGSTTPDTQATTTSTRPPTVAGPRDWAGLDDAIAGDVVLPSGRAYATAKGLFNTRFAHSTPAAIVRVKTTQDVHQAVQFAAKKGVKIAVRSGGHSYSGACAADGAMIVDLRQFTGETNYDANNDLVTIPAAAQLDSVQTMLAARGRSIPSGSCPTVGIAGLTLGGGLGSDSRRSGLTCDALVSAAVVLPGGESITASADDHTDLFWALRGGGANLGVVTSLTFRTFPIADRDVVTLVFPVGTAGQAIAGWHKWLPDADREIWGMVNVTADAGAQRCTIVLATPAGGGRDAASDLIAATSVRPDANTTRTLGRMDFVHYFEGGSQAAQPRSFLAGSDIIGDMTSAAADSVVTALSAWPAGSGSATAVLESLSGAVTDVGPGDTAFPWRRQAACVQWYSEPSADTVEDASAWLAAAHAAVQPHSVGGYVNYVEAGMPASRYFGENIDRLLDVRRTYDPAGLMYSGM